jgi:hypothetical protein
MSSNKPETSRTLIPNKCGFRFFKIAGILSAILTIELSVTRSEANAQNNDGFIVDAFSGKCELGAVRRHISDKVYVFKVLRAARNCDLPDRLFENGLPASAMTAVERDQQIQCLKGLGNGDLKAGVDTYERALRARSFYSEIEELLLLQITKDERESKKNMEYTCTAVARLLNVGIEKMSPPFAIRFQIVDGQLVLK